MPNALSQGYSALAFLYAGIVLGMLYGALRAVRTLADRRWATHLSDAVFVALFALVAYVAFQLTDFGRLRLYGLVLLLSGGVLPQWAFRLGICKRIVKRR